MMPCRYLLFVVICAFVRAEFSDKVAHEGANGAQVVEQAVSLISRTCFFSNELFLRRMAHVESRDGTAADTYKTGYNGGIWKVDESMFLATKNNPNLGDIYRKIDKSLGVDWSSVTWKDLRRPIISALAASLYVLSRNFKYIPDSLELQSTIWASLRPGNTANSFYFASVGLDNKCSGDRELDLVVVLDFANISVFDMVRVESFLETLLKQFNLSLNTTRVGLVTRNGKPTAGWYLNSQRAGLTILNVLKALVYHAGPATTEDALIFTRKTMFTYGNGSRPGAAKVALLITDGITQTQNVRTEAETLRKEGINLLIVEVNKTTASPGSKDLNLLVQEPTCQNGQHVPNYQSLLSLAPALQHVICEAPIIFPAGDFSYPCGTSLVARLPDSTTSTTLQVSTTKDDVDIFGSRTFTSPDNSSYDVHMTSTSGDSPVLFVRGTDPFFVRVKGQAQCTGTYTVHVKVGEAPTAGNGTCVIAGAVRPCNSSEMGQAKSDVILIPTSTFPFLCDEKKNDNEYFPHPLDPSKFLMCDEHDAVYVGLCPVNQTSCAQATSGCKYTNPCPKRASLDKPLFFDDPCGTLDTYVKCTFFGTAEVTNCRKGQVWNQDTGRCVSKYVHDPINNKDLTTIDNPCIHTHADHVYFPFPNDRSKYIFCDVHGSAFALSCRNGQWNQQTKTCSVLVPKLFG